MKKEKIKDGKDCRSRDSKDEEPSGEYSRVTRDRMTRNKVRVNYEDCAFSESEEEDDDDDDDDEDEEEEEVNFYGRNHRK